MRAKPYCMIEPTPEPDSKLSDMLAQEETTRMCTERMTSAYTFGVNSKTIGLKFIEFMLDSRPPPSGKKDPSS